MGFRPIFTPFFSTAAEPERQLDPIRHLKTTLDPLDRSGNPGAWTSRASVALSRDAGLQKV
jgi:hypothetical protein